MLIISGDEKDNHISLKWFSKILLFMYSVYLLKFKDLCV